MPKGDGKGPPAGVAQRGGRLRGSRAGAGPGGNCVCPDCGKKIPHRQGVPCYDLSCPDCGSKMMRE